MTTGTRIYIAVDAVDDDRRRLVVDGDMRLLGQLLATLRRETESEGRAPASLPPTPLRSGMIFAPLGDDIGVIRNSPTGVLRGREEESEDSLVTLS